LRSMSRIGCMHTWCEGSRDPNVMRKHIAVQRVTDRVWLICSFGSCSLCACLHPVARCVSWRHCLICSACRGKHTAKQNYRMTTVLQCTLYTSVPCHIPLHRGCSTVHARTTIRPCGAGAESLPLEPCWHHANMCVAAKASYKEIVTRSLALKQNKDKMNPSGIKPFTVQ
jgi:hypothetical protein